MKSISRRDVYKRQIQDNNEGNPLEAFTYTFSTGAELDSMAIAGTLLEASNLEPVKGMLVGLHANLADAALTTLPFDRGGRTDSRGQFSIQMCIRDRCCLCLLHVQGGTTKVIIISQRLFDERL